MEKHPSLPEQRNFEQALKESFQIACDRMSESDVPEICRKSGTEYTGTANVRTITVNYLGEDCRLVLPGCGISAAGSNEALPPRERLLVLHYLLTAKGSPLTNRQITIKEIPDGLTYYPTFVKRALKPLTDNFGNDPAKLPQTAGKIGGRQTAFGDAAATVRAFPRVPLTFVIWKGDDEFPASASILFDASITDYLPVEDIIVLSEITAWKLVRLAKQG